MYQHIKVFGSVVDAYSFFNNLSFVLMAVFTFLHLKRYKEINTYPKIVDRKFKKRELSFYFNETSCSVLELLLLLGLYAVSAQFLNRSFADVFTGGNANYFGNISAWFVVICIIPIALHISPLKNLDLFTPVLPLGLSVAKTACFFHGCCSGFAADTFYYNHVTERYEFPVQLVEVGCAVLLFVLLMIYRKKNKHPGSVYPLYIFTYSILRFGSEFLRDDLPNVLGPLDAYQILSIIFAVIGAVGLIITFQFGERINDYFDSKNKAFLDKQLAKIEKSRPQIHHSKKRKRK